MGGSVFALWLTLCEHEMDNPSTSTIQVRVRGVPLQLLRWSRCILHQHMGDIISIALNMNIVDMVKPRCKITYSTHQWTDRREQ
ncbi:hypothetical protein SLE2022_129060 [Rubroshorea leprosula]